MGINPPPESKQEGEEQEERPPILTQTNIKLLQIASSQLALTAVKENEAARLDGKALQLCKKSIDAIQAIIDAVPKEDPPGGLHPKLQVELVAPLVPYMDCHLLQQKSVETYAGAATEAKMPELADLLTLPVRVDNLAQALAAIIQCNNICNELLARTTDSSTSLKSVIQMEIVALIGSLFTEILPIPCPLTASPDSSQYQSCIWRGSGAMMKEMQLACLE
jgi:hypothetical protein